MTEAGSNPSLPARQPTKSRLIAEFVFGFACVFGGPLWPSAWIGNAYASAHAAIGNALVEQRAFESGVRLKFDRPEPTASADAWQALLMVTPPGSGQPLSVPIDLHALTFLPTATFIALAVAAPLGGALRNFRLLVVGLLLLEPLLLMLTALPLISFLGGWGPVRIFTLSAPVHALINVLYRALVAPPGMAYALPLLLFWALVRRFGSDQGEQRSPLAELLRLRPS